MMKTPAPLPVTAAPSASPAAPVATIDPIHAEFAPGTARLLLAVEVPVAALPVIETDWALVAQAQAVAPDLAPAMMSDALARLPHHALNVSGVAVAERLRNPFTKWVRHAA